MLVRRRSPMALPSMSLWKLQAGKRNDMTIIRRDAKERSLIEYLGTEGPGTTRTENQDTDRGHGA